MSMRNGQTVTRINRWDGYVRALDVCVKLPGRKRGLAISVTQLSHILTGRPEKPRVVWPTFAPVDGKSACMFARAILDAATVAAYMERVTEWGPPTTPGPWREGCTVVILEELPGFGYRLWRCPVNDPHRPLA